MLIVAITLLLIVVVVCRLYPRAPDETIGNGTELAHRWRLTPRPRRWARAMPALYLHHILRADNDPDKHDHPCDNVSFVLPLPGNGWLEQMADDTCVWRGPWTIVCRRAETPHRIAAVSGSGCWTLWLCMRARRDWGFWGAHGWISHREYFRRSAAAGKKER